jgi:hypothetical protein
VRLDDVADAQAVYVRLEASCEAAGYTLAAELGDGVGVHRVYVEGLGEGEGGVGERALAEADFVDGFGGGDYDFGDAELAGGFDDVVGAGYVAGVALVVLGGVSELLLALLEPLELESA